MPRGKSATQHQLTLKTHRVFEIPELVQHALSFLEGDPKSLKQCSLVCKLWTTLSTRYLFSESAPLTVDPASLMPSSANNGSMVPTYTYLNNKPRVVDNVRYINVDGRYNSLLRRAIPTIEVRFNPNAVSMSMVADLLANFPRCIHVSFSTSMHFTLHPEVLTDYHFRSTPDSWRGLQTLKLDLGPATFAFVSMTDVLAVFKKIDTLVLTGFSVGDRFQPSASRNTSTTPAALRCKVNHLVLRSFSGNAIPRVSPILAAAIDLASVKSLQVAHDRMGDATTHLNAFIAQHTPNVSRFLLHTHFRFPGHQIDFDNSRLHRRYIEVESALGVVLSPCASLEDITLVLPVRGYPGDAAWVSASVWLNAYMWKPALRVLLNVRPNTLSRITVRLVLSASNADDDEDPLSGFYLPLRTIDWAQLDGVLDRHPHLEALQVQFLHDTNHLEGAQQAVLKQLTERARKLVRFSRAIDVVDKN